MITLKKAELTAWFRHIRDIQNQECRFTIPKSWIGLAEKREEEGEEEQHRQL